MNFCECGHQPDDHDGLVGACDHTIETTDGGWAYDCTCQRYEWQAGQ